MRQGDCMGQRVGAIMGGAAQGLMLDLWPNPWLLAWNGLNEKEISEWQ